MTLHALFQEPLLLAALALTVASVLVVAFVLLFCCWLVRFTGKAESLREVPPLLRALPGLFRHATAERTTLPRRSAAVAAELRSRA